MCNDILRSLAIKWEKEQVFSSEKRIVLYNKICNSNMLNNNLKNEIYLFSSPVIK